MHRDLASIDNYAQVLARGEGGQRGEVARQALLQLSDSLVRLQGAARRFHAFFLPRGACPTLSDGIGLRRTDPYG